MGDEHKDLILATQLFAITRSMVDSIPMWTNEAVDTCIIAQPGDFHCIYVLVAATAETKVSVT